MLIYDYFGHHNKRWLYIQDEMFIIIIRTDNSWKEDIGVEVGIAHVSWLQTVH
jgi:hypothetical protein